MKKISAFTLAEMLLVFLIIGIIGSIGVVTVKPWEKAYKYSYIKIYNALSVAIYNHMVTTTNVATFPNTAQSFCNALLEYLNTANNAQNAAANNACNKTTGADAFLNNAPKESAFKGKSNPKILLSNGAKIWIGAASKNLPFSYTQTIDSSVTPNITDTIKYYLVYVDLNGNRGPNSVVYNVAGKDKRLPDIVAFAVTDKFTVLPLGYPKVDQRYLSAHIMYPVSEDDDEVTADGDRPSDSMTYYEAVVGAYGKGTDKIVTMGLTHTYDLEYSLPATNLFKLTNSPTDSTALDSYYKTAPTFDKVLCGDGKTAAQIKADKSDSHCDIKIFNYN